MEKLINPAVFNFAVSAATILLVDDDADDLLFLSSSISGLSPYLTLKQAYSVKEAMNYLGRLPDGQLPSLIVLDYNMPIQDGLDFLKIMQKEPRFRNIKKVVLSTAQFSLINNVCLESGAHACYSKPNSISQFKSLAEKILSEYLPS